MKCFFAEKKKKKKVKKKKKDREQELFGAALIFIPTCGGAARLSLSISDSEFSFLEFFHF